MWLERKDVVGSHVISTFIYHLVFTNSKELHEYVDIRNIVTDCFTKETQLVNANVPVADKLNSQSQSRN